MSRDDDLEAMIDELDAQPGPLPGEGRGPGRRWGGIIEDTPALWIGWVVDAAKHVGVDPATIGIQWGSVPLRMTTAQLTFGKRHYWVCPICRRRCEAVYLARFVGCRQCLRLGYRSQARRRSSAFRFLDGIFARRGPDSGRHGPVPDSVRHLLEAQLYGPLNRKIQEALGQVEVGGPVATVHLPDIDDPKNDF